ncbi:MAG: acyl--CoA ligase [Clostridia bacterium]|nr:acyl--CoA ligase [Clostridia bacterium]
MDKNSTNVFKKYTDEVTWSKIVDYENVSSMWQHCINEYADNIAIADGTSYTFKEVEKEVASVRALLNEKGIKAGDRVGIYMPNCCAFAISFLAITTMGAVAVLLPPHLDNVTVFGCTLKFQLKGLIYASEMEEKVAFAKEKNPAVIYITESERSNDSLEMTFVSGKEPCTILFTGGTTGKSKGALLSNKALMRGVKNGCFGTKNVFGQRYVLVLPLTHVFGLIRNLLTSLYTGSAIFICRNNKDMFRDIAVFKPTVMVLVPALAEMALNLSKKFGKNMLGDSIKTIICGAAVVPPYLVSEYDKIGVTLLPGYGLTESANLVSGNPESKKNAEAVGYIYEGIEYKIVDGELWIKGDNMMDCYVGEPEENELSYEDGYFKTGDLVRMDEDNMLYIVGRKKEIIVLPSGENVSPAELESKFNTIDAIQDSLVYLDKSNVLSLQVVPRLTVLNALKIEDKETFLKEQILEVNKTLPAFERINKIVIRETDFLRSPSMKILRKENSND